METIVVSSPLHSFYHALILPTRDGNILLPDLLVIFLGMALILPTRDGNQPKMQSVTETSVLWSYLQGMETQKKQIARKRFSELWSYLQGMETKQCQGIHSSVFYCFDPTYKGWKHIIKINPHFPIECFDPTYKGWKLNLFTIYLIANLRFDPTYKGWKLS